MPRNGNFRIKRHYSIIAHDPNVVELRYGVWNPTSFTLTDEAGSGHLFNLLTHLDGSLSSAELARQEKIAQEEVEDLVDHLIQLGVVETGPSTSLDHYLDQIVPTLKPVGPELPRDIPIVLLGDPDLTREIQRYLNDSAINNGLSVVKDDDPAWKIVREGDTSWLMNGIAFEEKVEAFRDWRDSFLVFATKVINPVQFQILNRVALHYRLPWMHAAIDGPFLLIGPIFVSYRSACYECFETRVTMNLRGSGSYERYKQAIVARSVKHGRLPIELVLAGLLGAHAALEVLNFALTRSSFTVGKVLSIYLPTMEFTFNEVLRVPGCNACSSLSERDDQELYFDLRTLIRDE